MKEMERGPQTLTVVIFHQKQNLLNIKSQSQLILLFNITLFISTVEKYEIFQKNIFVHTNNSSFPDWSFRIDES